jgi:hypothetical protein
LRGNEEWKGLLLGEGIGENRFAHK